MFDQNHNFIFHVLINILIIFQISLNLQSYCKFKKLFFVTNELNKLLSEKLNSITIIENAKPQNKSF